MLSWAASVCLLASFSLCYCDYLNWSSYYAKSKHENVYFTPLVTITGVFLSYRLISVQIIAATLLLHSMAWTGNFTRQWVIVSVHVAAVGVGCVETGSTKMHLRRTCNQSRVDCWVAMLVKVTSLTLSQCCLLTGTWVIWRSHTWTSLPKPLRTRDRESKMAERYACTQK